MRTHRKIKIGKCVEIIRYPWTFGFGVSLQKPYPKWKLLRIEIGFWSILVNFHSSIKQKYQTVRKDD